MDVIGYLVNNAQIAYYTLALVGGLFAIILPYLLKVWKDENLKFDITYFYALVVSTLISVGGLVPETDVFDLRTAVNVFLAALGLAGALAKANSVRKHAGEYTGLLET